MKFSLGIVALLCSPVAALHREDAGVLDFAIATAGHGVTRQVYATAETVLTSDSGSIPGSSTSSCYVAARSISTGELVWRRNVCSGSDETKGHQQHAVDASSSLMYTLDSAGIARAWSKEDGSLLWDVKISGGGVPGVWAIGDSLVAVVSDGDLTFLKASNGDAMDSISAVKALNSKLKGGERAQWLSIIAVGDALQGVVAFVQADGTSSRLWSVSMQVGNDEFTSTKSLNAKNVLTSSFQSHLIEDSWHGLAVTQGGAAVVFSLDSKSSDEYQAQYWNPDWTVVTSIRPIEVASIIAVQGSTSDGENAMGLYRSTGNGWETIHRSNGGAVSYCEDAKILVSLDANGPKAFSDGSPLSLSGDQFVVDGDFVEDISILYCSNDKVTTLLSTAGGTTTQIEFSMAGSSVTSKISWTAEEGLATISSAVFLDASHLGLDDLVEEQDTVANRLALSSRLSSQLQGLSSFFTSEGAYTRRDHTFGFVKIAALLSQKSHRIWGVMTSGTDRGSVRWSLDLPKCAEWHTMVHGTTNSNKAIHGINGGTHSREILVVSASADTVQWKCIDGTNGVVHAQDSVPIASPVSQVVPIYGSTGGCRQASVLLHEDRSLSTIPNDAATMELVKDQLIRSPNGMFTHLVDKHSSKIESFHVAVEGSSLTASKVGQTAFSGERIVKVAYPIRDEIVQSTSNILGDNALLLKYINPHLAAIITVTDETSKTSVAGVIEKEQGTSPKRKPIGAGDAVAAETKADESIPNMFVNLVDTVSGRGLYRASHANVDTDRDVTALISENWVIYSFVNERTRRTEVGVLTLHEGMIDPKGISLFKSPEQATSFSSFEARETKPAVLSKTYTFPKYITALGVTSTRGGISSRNILVASDDGRITTISRMMIETRRPMGEAKEAEKAEGLFPYNEMIMQIPFSAISYNRTLESVTSIVSAPTALESQSLVLAFGGPDIFFTRTSPSKGFDLLPDSFSRVLVSVVTVGLLVVLFVVRRMGEQKALKYSWQ